MIKCSLSLWVIRVAEEEESEFSVEVGLELNVERC